MSHASGLVPRVTLIVFAAASMVAMVGAVNVTVTRRSAAAAEVPSAHIIAADGVIDAEALAFAGRDDTLAHRLYGERAAHPRTLDTYRSLRAYPGAPPRVPHGLTAAEFRTTACRTCHERGGYAPRFNAWAPVTPHPELVECLQCHTADAAITGMPLPGSSPDAICRQCHGNNVLPARALDVDWRSAPWPQVQRPAVEGAPPAIPHTLELRGNCTACHAGPAAVSEIRTTHPERSNCRQCHVTATETDGVFTRPTATNTGGGQ